MALTLNVFLLFAFPVDAEKLPSVPITEPLQKRTSGELRQYYRSLLSARTAISYPVPLRPSSSCPFKDKALYIGASVIHLASNLHRLDVFLFLPIPESGGADIEFLEHLGFSQKPFLRLLDHRCKQFLCRLIDDVVGEFHKVFNLNVEGKTCDPTFDEFNNVAHNDICFRRRVKAWQDGGLSHPIPFVTMTWS